MASNGPARTDHTCNALLKTITEESPSPPTGRPVSRRGTSTPITQDTEVVSNLQVTDNMQTENLHPQRPQTETPRPQYPESQPLPVAPDASGAPEEPAQWYQAYQGWSWPALGSYIYKPSELQATETTPLTSTPSNGTPAGTWYSWVWGSTPDENYEDYTNDVELYKSAKTAIETSKDLVSYAFRGSVNSQFLVHDDEVSVATTASESQPVKYNIKRPLLSSAEVQETALNPPVQTSASSNSSVRSIESLPSTVAPSIDENFRIITLLTKLRLFGEKVIFQHNTSEAHLYRHAPAAIANRKLHSVKKVVVIAVHSFLPPKFVRSMVGHPTGSASQLAEQAVKAVQTWLGSAENMYNIDTIALEGMGTVKDRVESLLRLLENWHDLIAECDFLYVVGHSHGSLVAVELLAALVKSFHRKRIGFLSMAGPLCGPIKSLDSKIVVRAYTAKENEVLNELIQLQKPASAESQAFQHSFNEILQANVKVTLAGSIDDQLVPLESSLANSIYHPNIYRCVFIDPRSSIPPFVVSLWKLIVMTRNVGHVEHGLTKELSDRCIGSVADGGHSRIFMDPSVYRTAVRFALETTDLKQPRDLKVVSSPHDSSNSAFKIPWTIRELLEDILQTKHISSTLLVQQFLDEFLQWEPSKQWKDVRYALEALVETDYDDLLV